MKKQRNNAKAQKRGRVTQLDLEHRVQIACDFLVQGYAYSNIVKALMTQYKVSERQGKRYVELAQKKCAEIFSSQPAQNLLAELVSQTKYIHKLSLQEKDIPTALKSLEFQSRLVTLSGRVGGHLEQQSIGSENLSPGLEKLLAAIEQSDTE
jgi:hypothetical protein